MQFVPAEGARGSNRLLSMKKVLVRKERNELFSVDLLSVEVA